MIIKTKKYQLDKNEYLKIAFQQLLKKQWWFFAIPLVIFLAAPFLPGMGWWITLGIVTIIGYFLFWGAQFGGVTQMEQGQVMFEKLSYEINSQQIMLKLNTKQGMPIKWDQIKGGVAGKDHFLVMMSKAQFIHLPHKIFNNNNEIKFMESILKRKGFIK